MSRKNSFMLSSHEHASARSITSSFEGRVKSLQARFRAAHRLRDNGELKAVFREVQRLVGEVDTYYGELKEKKDLYDGFEARHRRLSESIGKLMGSKEFMRLAMHQ